MKYLILLLLMSSCSSGIDIAPEKQLEVTTLSLQAEIAKDSTLYNVVYKDNTLYILKDKVVVKKLINRRDAFLILFSITVILIIVIIVSTLNKN